jgi:hypothetical protein
MTEDAIQVVFQVEAQKMLVAVKHQVFQMTQVSNWFPIKPKNLREWPAYTL